MNTRPPSGGLLIEVYMDTETPIQTMSQFGQASISLMNTRLLANLVAFGGVSLGLSFEDLETTHNDCFSQIDDIDKSLIDFEVYSNELDLFLSRSSLMAGFKAGVMTPYINDPKRFVGLIGLLAFSTKLTGLNYLKTEYNFALELLTQPQPSKGVY